MTDTAHIADTFAQNLAIGGSPSARPATKAERALATGDTHAASFVGSPSIDLAFAVAPGGTGVLGDDLPVGPVSAVLEAAFTAAAESVGSQAPSPSPASADSMFHDTADVFAVEAAGELIGLFTFREHGTDGVTPASDETVAANISRISDVEMSLTVEIGRTRVAVRDVLGLEPGAVVELDRSAGAPADILLNGRLIALGEVVVVDQDYAVRVTKILDRATV